MKSSGNKFNAHKVTFAGISFDSRKEMMRYLALRDKEKRGEILGLKVHHPMILFEKSAYGREIKYIADFVYVDPKEGLIVEDVKGMKKGAVYQLFRLKARIVAEKYNIKVREV